jgi:hypothetical protein
MQYADVLEHVNVYVYGAVFLGSTGSPVASDPVAIVVQFAAYALLSA